MKIGPFHAILENGLIFYCLSGPPISIKTAYTVASHATSTQLSPTVPQEPFR